VIYQDLKGKRDEIRTSYANGLPQTINPMGLGIIVRYKVTRGDPQIPTEIRETPETGLNLKPGQTSDFS
jgi:hypothetical protein